MPLTRQLNYYAETRPWEILGDYGEYKEIQQPGKILLGFKGKEVNGNIQLDIDQPVYLDYNEYSQNNPSILIQGKKGSGKTTLMTNLVLHQFYRLYHHNIFIVDPKASLASHKYPNDNQKQVKFLEEINFPARGMPIKTITPLMFRSSPKYKDTDIYYGISMEDIKGIKEFSIRKQMLASLLGVTGSNYEGSIRKLSEIMLRDPQSFTEMLDIAKELNSKAEWRRMRVIDNMIKQRIAEGVLVDGGHLDIIELMQNNIVALQTSLSSTEEINSTYVALALAQIKEGLESKKLRGNTVIVADEGDILAPSGSANPPSKPFMEQMYTKWRSEGVIPIAVSQDPSRLSQTILQQVDYLLTPRVGYQTNEAAFIRALFPTINTLELTQLYYGKISTYPKEWVLISSEEIVSFFPIYSPSLPHFPKEHFFKGKA